MKAYDVIVIGAGMAGASVAYELATDRRVLLLDTESQPGYHSTGRSAAVYVPSYDFHNRALFTLTRASRSQLETPEESFHSGSLLHSRGLLYIGTRGELPALETVYDELVGAFPGVQWVDTKFIRRLLPALADEYSGNAVFDADVSDIDVHGLHQAYLRGLRHRGGEVLCSAEVLAAERRNGAWQVSARGEVCCAPVLVNAAGAWVDRVAELAGVATIGIQPLRRTAVLLDPPPGVNVDGWPAATEFKGSFYFKPDASLVMASPADETPSVPCDAQPEELDVAYAAHFAEQALGMEVQRVRSCWAGLRCFVADRTPVVGYARDAEGFFWMAGQGGHGIQIAPATARLAAALVRREPLPEDLVELGFDTAWVAPDRLAN